MALAADGLEHGAAHALVGGGKLVEAADALHVGSSLSSSRIAPSRTTLSTTISEPGRESLIAHS